MADVSHQENLLKVEDRDPDPQTLSLQPLRTSLQHRRPPPHSPLDLSLYPAPQLTKPVKSDEPLNISEPVSHLPQGRERKEKDTPVSLPLPPTPGNETSRRAGRGLGADLAAVGVLHHEAQAVVCLEGVLQRLRERRWQRGRWEDGWLSAGSQETRRC